MQRYLSVLFVALIAMTGCTPNIQNNEEVIETEPTINGLSENERMTIWDEYIRAQDRVRLEITRSLEILDPNDPKYADMRNEFDHDLYSRQFGERETLIKLKQDEYEREVAEKFGLTHEQLTEIGNEGTRKEWPFPPEPEGLWN